MRSRAPTGTTKYKTQSQWGCYEPCLVKTSGECPHSSRGSGATVGYHKKGYPKQELKILLKPCKNQSQRTTTRSRQILRLAQGLRRGLRRKAKALRPVEALSPRPPRRGPAPQYQDTNSPIRPRLGSATTSSPPSRPTPLTKCHVQPIRPTTLATSAARWHSTGRMTDGIGDRAQQGLPTTVLITVPPADTRTALCYLTPALRTKWHGGSSPGPCSLGISMKDQPLVLRLVRDPPAGPRTYYSFSASAEAGLVPHPRRLRLNRPSGEPSHPFKCAWSHLLRQPRLAGYNNRGDGTAVKSPFYHPLLTV